MAHFDLNVGTVLIFRDFDMDARALQVGFWATIRKINSSTSLGVVLLPTRVLALEISLQYKRNPARCQRTTVSGVTSRPFSTSEIKKPGGTIGCSKCDSQ